jgi:hypothetical protein
MYKRCLVAALLAAATLALAGCGGAQGPAGPGLSGTNAASLVDDAFNNSGSSVLGISHRPAYASNSLAYDSSITDSIPMNVGSVSGALSADGSSSMIDTGLEDSPFDSLSLGSDMDSSTMLTSLEDDMAFDSDTAIGCNGDESGNYDAGSTGIPEIDDAIAEQDMAMMDAGMDDGIGMDLAGPESC